MARPRFQQHPIASRIWGTICDALLNCVNVDSAPKMLVQPLPLSTFHNLIYREVWRFWMLAMKQHSGDPNFIRDLKFRFDCCLCHADPHILDSNIPCNLELSITLSHCAPPHHCAPSGGKFRYHFYLELWGCGPLAS